MVHAAGYFPLCLHAHAETLRDEMAELPAVLVGVMVASSSEGDRGLRLKDTSGEIPCEVSYMQLIHDVTLLKYNYCISATSPGW